MAVKANAQKNDTLRFPIQDRRGDPFTWNRKSVFDIADTAYVKRSVEYDPITHRYYITEKIGSRYYRKPTYLNYEEFWKLSNQQAETDYFQARARTLDELNKKAKRPKMKLYNTLFDRMFGLDSNGLKVDIKPQGTVDLALGYQGQKIDNPSFSESARKTGGFDFDMNANLSVLSNIGNKLKLPINYNTLANFDFENQMKLDYKGMDDEIIRSIEAGNISFQTKSTLVSGVQSLFGIKTQLQFGRLGITAAIANQKSEKKSTTLSGGSAATTISKKLDDYDENRNFLLAQYFRNNFNKAMGSLPVVNSQVKVTRMEVWVTNRTGSTTSARYIAALADLGETSPANSANTTLTTNSLPQNNANDLYGYVTGNETYRNSNSITSFLKARGLTQVNDFEKIYARKLSSSEYIYNEKVGFLCLSAQLQSSDALAVAFQYTYNGKVYQVGEFSEDVTVDSTSGIQKVLFLKLLKATSQRVSLPMWHLMMKNVYAVGVTGVDSADFTFNVLYREASGGDKIYLPESAAAAEGKSLLSILRLDRLNSQQNTIPDGMFDYVNGYTILPAQGKIIFPVLEPFGKDLDTLAFGGMPSSVKAKYVYHALYDSIKVVAQTYANLNRFVATGAVKGTAASSLSLGAFNIPQGSVTVRAGANTLTENSDYTVDYNLGTVSIINQSLLASGTAITIDYESASYSMQQRNFMGLRLDYKASDKLTLGATFEHLGTTPFYSKVNVGDDPISNSIYGLDFTYASQAPGITRLLNKLPFYHTTATSAVNASGELAYLKPGHSSLIGSGTSGAVYIDDFEGASSSIDIRYPSTSWALASTPAGNGLFPEADLNDSLDYGRSRAKLAWYTIETTLQNSSSSSNPLRKNLAVLSDPRMRAVYTSELYPDRTTTLTDVQLSTFDLAYYPEERGPYNFETRSTELTAEGRLRNPKTKWGGIMRSIDQSDFETANIAYIEFWVQDPFIKHSASTGGKLYVNLGSVSEDVLKDGKHFYENGLSTPTQATTLDSSGTWGKVPVNPVQQTQAFSNEASDRVYQDLGFDGLNNTEERRKRNNYLLDLLRNYSVNSIIYQQAYDDPSGDDYVWYRDDRFTENADILARYKNYNNPQGNSPVVSGSSTISAAATTYPDNEDLNRDNVMNETEAYYEYAIDLTPSGMVVGSNYITDKRTVTPTLADGSTTTENWYLFRIPVEGYTSAVNGISDFKSIQFSRMYLSGFEDSVVMRFAALNLVRNQWKAFTYTLDTTGSYTKLSSSATAAIDITSVGLEDNSARTPVPYKIPPGINRVQTLSSTNSTILENEQSMSLKITGLSDGDARAVFKTMSLDARKYGKLSMFIHAEAVSGQVAVQHKDLNAVIRIGQDFLSNYYEIKVPLTMTALSGTATSEMVWPAANNLDFSLQQLISLKAERNDKGTTSGTIYRKETDGKTFSIMGNPNLGDVGGILIGVENPAGGNTAALSAEIWVDELRLSEIDEHGAWAAIGRVDMQLGDLGSVSLAGSTYSQGWGSVEQSLSERSLNSTTQVDAVMQIDAGKLLPSKAGFTIPMYAGYSKTVSTPEYDPYNLDIKLKSSLKNVSEQKRDSILNTAREIATMQTLTFTNVRFAKAPAKPRLWNLSNFDFTFAYTKSGETSPVIMLNDIRKYRGGFGYTYIGTSKYIQPFKQAGWKSSWLQLIKDFNFNLTPSFISFRTDINRQMGMYSPRIVNAYNNTITRVDTTYNKKFTFDRYYNLRWDLSHSLNIDFSATNKAVVDEPEGAINTKAKRDSISKNFWKGGRPLYYLQKVTASYTLPLAKFPVTDWVTTRYSYSASYSYTSASLAAKYLGNTLQNSLDQNVTAELDFSRLYSKWHWLARTGGSQPIARGTKQIGASKASVVRIPAPLPDKAEIIKGLHGKARRMALRKWRQQKIDLRRQARLQIVNTASIGSVGQATVTLLTMVKRASVSYATNVSSYVPGYMDSTQFLGQNWKSMQPGMDFILGKQPDAAWLEQKARLGLLSADSSFNDYFQQNFSQQFSLAATVQPIRDFNIEVTMQKTFSKNYSELYKDTTGSGLHFAHLSGTANGGFSVSFISFQTLFRKSSPSQVSVTFKTFQNNRLIVSSRVARANPYQDGTKTADGYYTGYGRYSQSVLIPAFIAAYTNKDAHTISLLKESNTGVTANPFSGIKPLPNWSASYSGLSRLPALSTIFSNVVITHAYMGTLSMNSFTSDLTYNDPLHLGTPGFIDTTSGNFVPYYIVPNITIQEQFSPLIGIDVTTLKQLNVHVKYNRSRQLSLSLSDYQLSEVQSSGWDFGLSWRTHGLQLPFALPGMKQGQRRLQNDLGITLDVSYRRDAQSTSVLDENVTYVTGGQRVIKIQPSVEYVLNKRINVTLYFDQQKNIPYMSTSAPVTVTKGGVKIRISLAP